MAVERSWVMEAQQYQQTPSLLIQYLDGDKALKKITAASAGTNAVENGLSAPKLD
jgi:type IV pilus assembly protein PilY1